MNFDALVLTPQVFTYPSDQYGFQDLVKRMLGVQADDLSLIHQDIALVQGDLQRRGILFDDPRTNNVFKTDQSSCFHRAFYGSPLLEDFTRVYHRFVQKELLRLFHGEREFAVQTTPTFRVQVPGTTALGDNHEIVSAEHYEHAPKDAVGLHNDFMYRHPPGEMNFIVPLTALQNTLWFQTGPSQWEWEPVRAGVGEYFQFYGNRLCHFNKLNKSEFTRVSFDCRVIPMCRWVDVKEQSMTRGTKFEIGGYYTLLRKEEDNNPEK
jgi:hypothetical protein